MVAEKKLQKKKLRKEMKNSIKKKRKKWSEEDCSGKICEIEKKR